MPDRLMKLRATLTELEHELRELPAVDGETRALLGEAMREISAVLSASARAPAEATENVPRGKEAAPSVSPGAPASPGTLTERLQQSIESFEAHHPRLTGVLGRLVDALGQMGI